MTKLYVCHFMSNVIYISYEDDFKNHIVYGQERTKAVCLECCTKHII